MTEYELHTQGGVIAVSPKHDGRDPMRNRPHSNGTDMTIKRYGLDRDYSNNIGVPAIKEMADGAYVRYEDHQRLMAACEAHNEMLLGRLKLAESAQPVSDDAIYLGCARMGLAEASDDEVINYVRIAKQRAALTQQEKV